MPRLLRRLLRAVLRPSLLPKGRVRLLRGDREHARADAPALRRALERGALRLRASRLAASSDQLLRRRHACPVVALILCPVSGADRPKRPSVLLDAE